ncbi:MAG: inorganic diphosphatase [Clostridia bacterium]|nr:inorganic diphosphatase [Clostridia bacterium]
MLGQKVRVTVDRPLGSCHPQHENLYYPINYGYIEETLAPDGEAQDAYILGVDQPLAEFEGIVIAVIHRTDDIEEKWVVAPEETSFTKEEIENAVRFQEQYFDSFVIVDRI